MQKAVNGKKGYGIDRDYRDRDVLAVWRYLPHFRWGMVVKIDTKEAFRVIAKLRAWSFFIGVITTITVILIAFLVSDSISNPIINLTRTTKQIAGGDLISKVDIKGSIEIGELGASFNKMMETIEMSRRELEKHRDHLVELVDERTKELKDAQEKLISEERFAIMGKLSGSIAHEIRNPLAAIDATAYYLKKKLKDADENTKIRLDRIIDQVREMADIIQSLQDLTKVKEPQRVRVAICDTIENFLKTYKLPRDIKIFKKFSEDKLMVEIDERQIFIVFRNILTNALEAMENKGTIWISTYRAKDGRVEASVVNSGTGIASENIKKIFQPFFGTKARGFGYGLTISKMIMEKHGGSMEAYSEGGKGVVLVLRFPFAG